MEGTRAECMGIWDQRVAIYAALRRGAYSRRTQNGSCWHNYRDLTSQKEESSSFPDKLAEATAFRSSSNSRWQIRRFPNWSWLNGRGPNAPGRGTRRILVLRTRSRLNERNAPAAAVRVAPARSAVSALAAAARAAAAAPDAEVCRHATDTCAEASRRHTTEAAKTAAHLGVGGLV